MISFIFKIQNSKKDFRQGKMNKIRIHRKIKDGSNSFNFEFPLPNWAFFTVDNVHVLNPWSFGVFFYIQNSKRTFYLGKWTKFLWAEKKQRLMYFFQLWIPTAYLFSYFLLLMYKALNKINHLFMYVGKPIIFLML